MGNTVNKNKNSNLSYARGTLAHINKLIEDEYFTAPGFCFFTDKECIGFLDVNNQLYVINLDRIETLESQMQQLNSSIGDISENIPEGTNLVEYVVGVNTQVAEVTNSVSMITSKDIVNESGVTE